MPRNLVSDDNTLRLKLKTRNYPAYQAFSLQNCVWHCAGSLGVLGTLGTLGNIGNGCSVLVPMLALVWRLNIESLSDLQEAKVQTES